MPVSWYLSVMEDTTLQAFQQLFETIRTLRGPDGCMWDKEQTAETLKASIIEEAFECVDAITGGDNEQIQEELGDLYLLATLVSYIKEQENEFTVAEVLTTVKDKLIRRHPHVFATAKVSNSDEVIAQWNDIKKNEKNGDKEASILDKSGKSLPPLERALRFQKTAAKVGFDWEKIGDVWIKVEEEMAELKEACESAVQPDIEEELGDLMFSLVNVARFLKIDPLLALHGANRKFYSRFNAIEKEAHTAGRTLESMTLEEMDDIWKRQKGHNSEK